MFLLQHNVCHTSPSLNQGKVVKASLPLLELELEPEQDWSGRQCEEEETRPVPQGHRPLLQLQGMRRRMRQRLWRKSGSAIQGWPAGKRARVGDSMISNGSLTDRDAVSTTYPRCPNGDHAWPLVALNGPQFNCFFNRTSRVGTAAHPGDIQFMPYVARATCLESVHARPHCSP